jgi:hypothetical protein
MMKVRLGFWPPTNLWHHGKVLGYYYLDHEPRFQRLQQLSDRDARRVRFIEAHGGYGMHEFINRPCTYITMLREPVDRTLSTYYFLKSEGSLPDDMTLERWLVDYPPHRVWFADNTQIRYLAAEHGEIINVPNGEVTRDMLERAKQHIKDHFTLVGLSEQFDASMVLLRRRLGWRSVAYGRSNVTRQRQHKDELPESTLDLIRERNSLDIELYNWAVERFEQAVADEGPDFQRELEAFQKKMQQRSGRLSVAYRLLGLGTKTRRRILQAIQRT